MPANIVHVKGTTQKFREFDQRVREKKKKEKSKTELVSTISFEVVFLGLR